ncbi:MAG: hypothetical protein OXD44_08975 [Gammaproteobacteria bacterium]|nr:hypothetical protein [Gammaproteobacteria bacterium]
MPATAHFAESSGILVKFRNLAYAVQAACTIWKSGVTLVLYQDSMHCVILTQANPAVNSAGSPDIAEISSSAKFSECILENMING